ncbi:MAG: MBL fold metallo-hydrolase, partial [Candidatus Hydrogenedentes bacterium]|nr:MBL fold metallo-hydrolase [Candidatus Hydrogenedentota bacterium]
MKITSYGAAGGVTGSKHLLEINGYRILLDCGMFQGRRQEADVKNRHLGFEARSVNATILSHAHIDHSGLLPVLDRNGYNAFIYSTCATRDLCSIMLKDSAHIQARDAEWLSKKNRTFVPPLYQDIDVQEVMKRFKCTPYGGRFEVVPGIHATFQDAGHVLGSAIVCVEYAENGSTKRLIFSGDLGRKNAPILQDPWQPDAADTV